MPLTDGVRRRGASDQQERPRSALDGKLATNAVMIRAGALQCFADRLADHCRTNPHLSSLFVFHGCSPAVRRVSLSRTPETNRTPTRDCGDNAFIKLLQRTQELRQRRKVSIQPQSRLPFGGMGSASRRANHTLRERGNARKGNFRASRAGSAYVADCAGRSGNTSDRVRRRGRSMRSRRVCGVPTDLARNASGHSIATEQDGTARNDRSELREGPEWQADSSARSLAGGGRNFPVVEPAGCSGAVAARHSVLRLSDDDTRRATGWSWGVGTCRQSPPDSAAPRGSVPRRSRRRCRRAV